MAETLDDFNMEGDAVLDEYKPDKYDHLLNVRFYFKAKIDAPATEKAGRPVYKQREMVKIVPMGDRTFSYDGPVQPSHIRRFKARYDQWRARSNEDQIQGTLLESWPLVTEAQRAELKYFNVVTVEQLAEVPDACPMFGIQALKAKARRFVDAQELAAPTVRFQMELDKRDKNFAALSAQVAALLKKLGENPDVLE